MSFKCKHCAKCFSRAGFMRDFTLGKSLMTVNSVASVLAKQEA